MPTSLVFDYGDEPGPRKVAVELLVQGEGPPVLMIPSLGRGGKDFDDLGARLAAAGFRAAAINPRGVGASAGPPAQTLFDYARDVAEAARRLSSSPAVLIGHAFGNRVARATATRHPECASSLILLAAGGQAAPAPEASKALQDVFDESLTPEAHIAAVKTAFFAPGNDPEVWRGGWFPAVQRAQQAAGRGTPPGAWTAAGAAPILVVQAADDVIAPPANARALLDAYPDRVTVLTLPGAGHAMLPEQPERIAEIVTRRLRDLAEG